MTVLLPALLDEDDDEGSPAGLFGAAAVGAGRWTPGIVVDIVGQAFASNVTGPGPLIVDGVSVSWGRDDVLSQPDMSTARMSLFDATATWALTRDLVGQQVRLAFRGTPPSTSGAQDGVTGTTFQREFFRGRVQTVRVVPKTVVHPDTGAEVRGSLIHFTLSSILADLANRVPTAAWPAETLGQRCDRIAAAAVDVLPSSVVMRTYWRTPQVAPVAAGEQVSIYDHLLSVFDSCGCDRLTHYPSIGRVEYLARREYAENVRTLGTLWWDGSSTSGQARAGQGIYIRANGAWSEDFGGAAEMWPGYLDADEVEFSRGDGLVRGPGSRITRVQVPHPDAAAAYAMTAGEVVVGNETLTGVRAARIESIVAWNAWADIACQDLADYVQKEGAAWGTDPLRFSTARAGGFATLAQAIWMLSAAELPSVFFLEGSELHSRYGLRPIVGLMGGQITYRDGDWDVELHPSPVITRAKQHAITWEEIDDGSTTYEVQWHDGLHPRGVHESVTYEDMGWVGTGLNVGTPGSDQGWDFYA